LNALGFNRNIAVRLLKQTCKGFDTVDINGLTEELRVNDANLSHSSFEDVNLSGSSFKSVRLTTVRFKDVDLTNTKISDANLTKVEIQNCNLTDMRINGIPVVELLAAYDSVQAQRKA